MNGGLSGAARQRGSSLSRVALGVLLLVLLGLLQGDTLRLSPTARAAAPHAFSVEGWVLRNLPAKAVDRLRGVLPWGRPAPEERLAQVREFYALGEEAGRLRGELAGRAARRAGEGDAGPAPRGDAGRIAALEGRLRDLQDRRSALEPVVEGAMEDALADALEGEGLQRGLGPLRGLFPPAVFSLDRLPRLLVVSPRDRIQMMEARLLSPGLTLASAEGLEGRLFREEDLSAVVLDLGGLATYPSLVPDTQPLRAALQTAAHEWLHQYFFFAPLGRGYYAVPEMTTLNETAAEMAGRELGDLAYQRMGFQLPPAPPASAAAGPGPGAFDFAGEMRETRRQVDRLLGQGLVEEAEAYMEERRRLFVENGRPIRRLNQAYFAFHGTYAESPASSSPIAGQLRAVREQSADVGAFVRVVAGFGSHQDLLTYLEGLPRGQ